MQTYHVCMVIRVFIALISCAFCLVQLPAVHAQNSVSIPKGKSALVTSQTPISELYDRLARQTKPAQAARTARDIQEKWGDSGSASINVLMQWSAQAMKSRKLPNALDILDQVIVLAPDYAEGWNRRATLYFTQKKYGKSLADIERVLSIDPKHFGALSGLAAILQTLGQNEKALETWYRVLSVYPANKAAQEAVIKLEEELAGTPT